MGPEFIHEDVECTFPHLIREVYEKRETGGSCDMLEESETESRAPAGPLDDAGDVRQNELGLVDIHHTEVGDPGGEGIRGDTGVRIGHDTEEGGFTCVRGHRSSRFGCKSDVPDESWCVNIDGDPAVKGA